MSKTYKLPNNINKARNFSISNKFGFIKLQKYFLIVLLLSFMILLVVYPDYFLSSAKKGLLIFATSVLPALFPFYFFSLILTNIGGADLISKIGRRPFKFLFNTPPEGAYIFTMSVLTGYPVGASLIRDFFESNRLTTSQAKSIFAFASTSGPVFILGTLATAVFANPNIGIILFISHYISSILNGLIFRNRETNQPTKILSTPVPTQNILSMSITKSTSSMLILGGYIVLGSIFVDAICLIDFERLLHSLPPDISNSIISLITGSIEMTRGCIQASNIVSMQLKLSIASFILTFGGITVMLQSYNFLSECGIKFRDIFIRKLCQSILAFLIAYILSFALV